MLAHGYETYFGGLFLIIPFLLQAKVWRFAGELWTDVSAKGLGAMQVYLVLLFSVLGGIKDLNRLRDIQDLGLAALAGLPKLSSPASLHDYLGRVKLSGLTIVKLSTARVLKRMGLIRGGVVKIDVHITEYFGKEQLPKGQHGTKEKSGCRRFESCMANQENQGLPGFPGAFFARLSAGLSATRLTSRVRSGTLEISLMRAWRNGRRAGLRIRWVTPCGFKSHRPHQTQGLQGLGRLPHIP